MNPSKERILITGGNGFLGSHVVNALRNSGWENILTPTSLQCDLRNKDHIEKFFEKQKIDYVIHLAAVVGGIGANQKNPGRFFYENAMMGIQLMELSRKAGVKKWLTTGTVCSYPKFTDVPFLEENLWNGYPEETNAPYGMAKKMLLVQGQAYRQQYGFNSVHLLLVNLFGPRDNFDLESSHVIPAMIRKCIDAKKMKEKKVVFWGDGSPSREFIFVEDAAHAICLAFENYNGSAPINIGTGQDITMKELGQMIAQLTGFKGEMVWDTSRPNGQPVRRLDVRKAKKEFGFTAKHTFLEGLEKTVAWYSSAAKKAA